MSHFSTSFSLVQWEAIQSDWLHLFDFSPLCVFQMPERKLCLTLSAFAGSMGSHSIRPELPFNQLGQANSVENEAWLVHWHKGNPCEYIPFILGYCHELRTNICSLPSQYWRAVIRLF